MQKNKKADLKIIKVFTNKGKQVLYEVKLADGGTVKVPPSQMLCIMDTYLPMRQYHLKVLLG